MRTRVLSTIAFSLAVLALAPGAHATFPGKNGKIAFTLYNDLFDPGETPRTGIYSIEADGRALVRLADMPGLLAWSPDGRRIAFSGYRNGRRDLYVMRADGSGLRRITRDAASEWRPVWSPDGRWLAFERYERTMTKDGPQEAPPEIYVVRPDGTAKANLTRSKVAEAGPTWSPDGTRLAFVRHHGGGLRNGNDADIHVVNADGTGRRVLFDSSSLRVYGLGTPAWSPDGSQIVFQADFLKEQHTFIERQHIYVIDADDGGGLRRLSGDHDTEPHWSPDGAKIAFLRERTGVEGPPEWEDVFVMNADGTDARAVTSSHNARYNVTWSPDGRRIAFAEGGEGTALVVTNIDGSGARRLTEPMVGNAILGASSIDWQPLVPPPPPPIAGTPRSDVVAGTPGADTLIGGEGNDTIWARAGADTAYGGDGDDAVFGEAGADILYGRAGRDRLHGGAGWDTVIGGAGNDRVFARDGRRDWIFCGPGRDRATADRVDLVAGCETIARL